MERHIAVFTSPGYGHVYPVLPVLEQLVRRGHRVTCVTAPSFAELIAGTGAEVLTYQTWTFSEARPFRDEGDGRPPHLDADIAARAAMFLLETSIAALPAAQERFEDDRPDLILFDMASPVTARILARKWGVPAVELFSTFASNEHYSLDGSLGEEVGPVAEDDPALREVKDKLAAVLAEQGIAEDDFDITAKDLALVFMPRGFQYAGDTFGDEYLFTGPCLGSRGATQGEWTPPSDGSPVLLISLGTVNNRNPEFFAICAKAFAGSRWHVVMSIGQHLSAEDLGPLPANVEVHQRVPQLAVLEHAEAAVTHAGMGSTMEALNYGVPLVTVPQMPEQHQVARRVTELGLGLEIRPENVTADALRDAVEEIYTSTEVRQKVAWMQDCIRTAGGATRAVQSLEDLMDQRR